jgi:hypothetical protein
MSKEAKTNGELVKLGNREFRISSDGSTFEYVRKLRDEEISPWDPFDIEEAAKADRLAQIKPKTESAGREYEDAAEWALSAPRVEGENPYKWERGYPSALSGQLAWALEIEDTEECVQLIAEMVWIAALNTEASHRVEGRWRALASWIWWLYHEMPLPEGEALRYYGKVFADTLLFLDFRNKDGRTYKERRKEAIDHLCKISARDWRRLPVAEAEKAA